MRERDVTELAHRLGHRVRAQVSSRGRLLVQLRRQLDTFDLGRRLASFRTRLTTADGRLRTTVDRRRQHSHARLREMAGRLDSLSPLAVLGRGYAVAWSADGSHALRDATEVSAGDRIRVTLARGELECDVLKAETRHE
jgi:exodeoxyribonuclease VII large subunit